VLREGIENKTAVYVQGKTIGIILNDLLCSRNVLFPGHQLQYRLYDQEGIGQKIQHAYPLHPSGEKRSPEERNHFGQNFLGIRILLEQRLVGTGLAVRVPSARFDWLLLLWHAGRKNRHNSLALLR
jgi:hypothetical protein